FVRSRGGALQVRARAGAEEREALRIEHAERLAVHLPTLALFEHRAVPAQAEPLEVLVDGVDVLGPAAIGVEVLDAQQELATRSARLQPTEQRRAGVAQVHQPRR